MYVSVYLRGGCAMVYFKNVIQTRKHVHSNPEVFVSVRTLTFLCGLMHLYFSLVKWISSLLCDSLAEFFCLLQFYGTPKSLKMKSYV